MSIESFSPLPLNVFSTWVTLLDPSDVPIGMSPNLGDVDFFPGGVRTRAGLVSQFPVLGGAPQINGLKTYITTNLAQRLLVFDSLGNLYKETSPGVLSFAAIGRRGAKSLSRLDHAFSAASTWPSATAPPARICRANMTTRTSIASARSVPPKDPRSRIRTAGSISPGVHQCVGRVRHAPGILDRAFAARFVDRRGQPASERHEYSHRPVERGAAAARIHRLGRREFLSRARPRW